MAGHLNVLCAQCVSQTVDFNNTRTFTTTADRYVYVDVPGGTRLVGTNFMAQLYYGPNQTPAGSLNPVNSPPTRFRNVPTTDPLAGTWTGVTRTLTGFNFGDVVTLQVRIWDIHTGATWETASFRASSGTFTYSIPPPGSLPSAFFIENFRGGLAIPEPSVVVLGIVGAGVLLLARRRKFNGA